MQDNEYKETDSIISYSRLSQLQCRGYEKKIKSIFFLRFHTKYQKDVKQGIFVEATHPPPPNLKKNTQKLVF